MEKEKFTELFHQYVKHKKMLGEDSGVVSKVKGALEEGIRSSKRAAKLYRGFESRILHSDQKALEIVDSLNPELYRGLQKMSSTIDSLLIEGDTSYASTLMQRFNEAVDSFEVLTGRKNLDVARATRLVATVKALSNDYSKEVSPFTTAAHYSALLLGAIGIYYLAKFGRQVVKRFRDPRWIFED